MSWYVKNQSYKHMAGKLLPEYPEMLRDQNQSTGLSLCNAFVRVQNHASSSNLSSKIMQFL
jgi:hypothetical protein